MAHETLDASRCAVHELRITAIEESLKALADTVKSIEQTINRAIGGAAALMCLQPIFTGLVLYWLTRR